MKTLEERRKEVAKYQGCIIATIYYDNTPEGLKKGRTVGLISDGTVVATGYNYSKQCETGGWQNIVAISASAEHTVGLKADGTVIAVGNNIYGQCKILDWRDIISIYTGDYHTIGLKANGTVVVVGYEGVYSSKLDTKDWQNIVAISMHSSFISTEKVSLTYGHAVGMKADGTVVSTGIAKFEDIKNWDDIVAISVCKNVQCMSIVGLKSDGTVVAVGNNKFGECNTGSWRDIVAITTGIIHTVGLKSDGTVVVASDFHDTKGWRDIIAISAGGHTVGLKYDGTVVADGNNDYGQCNTQYWRDIVAISAGAYHTVGLKVDGTVVAVGKNSEGECDTEWWENIGPVSEDQRQTMVWRAQGKCDKCGGNFTFWKKICKSCGKQ